MLDKKSVVLSSLRCHECISNIEGSVLAGGTSNMSQWHVVSVRGVGRIDKENMLNIWVLAK